MKTSLLVVLAGVLLVAGPVTAQDTDSIHLPQCITNDDCLDTLTCNHLKCEDPCLGRCTVNATCNVLDHVPYCSCKPGFTGDPLTGCKEQAPTLQHQCTKNDECPQDRTCIDQKCEDPCIDVCSGNNTICQVRKHVPYCSCKPGYSGDPLSGCILQYPAGSWPPYPGAKKRYKVETVKTNWFAAFTNCLNHGGRLATISSSAENDEIKAVIRNSGINGNFWTSGIDLAIDRHFTWMSTGLPVTFSDWGAGQPDTYKGEEHCLHLWKDINYLWNDDNCLDIQYSVCEYYD